MQLGIKRVIAAIVLTLTLTVVTFGGDIPSPGANAPTCPPGQTCLTGDIPSPGSAAAPSDPASVSPLDALTEAILDVMSLFAAVSR